MKNIKKFLPLLLAFLFYLPAAIAQNPVITAGEFMKVYKDKNTRVISAQKLKNYSSMHITGAIHIDHHDLYKSSGPKGMLKSPDELTKIFGQAGISNKNLIVVYDDGKNKAAARIYWVLKYLGAEKVRVLHKDLAQWRKSRVPITKSVKKAKPTTFTPKANKAIYADMAYVKAHMNQGNTLIIDARSKGEYKGEPGNIEDSKGHIPGAINIEWSEVENEKGAFLSNEQLKKVFARYKVSKDKNIILYCGTSVRAATLFIALKKLGYPHVRVYDGAYNEWTAKGGKLSK